MTRALTGLGGALALALLIPVTAAAQEPPMDQAFEVGLAQRAEASWRAEAAQSKPPASEPARVEPPACPPVRQAAPPPVAQPSCPTGEPACPR